MKTHFLKAFVFIVLAGFLNACNDTLVEEANDVDSLLKSAQSTKISYIVVLNDAELETELANLKGYEMRQQVAKRAAEKVLNRAAVTDGELGFVYSTALKGFSVKIPPGQLKKLENDPAVLRITEDQVITLIEPNASPGGGDVQASAQTIPWGISRVGGGLNYTGESVAWIIDTGIDLDHPDLNVDVSRSAWFVSRVSSANDDNGHGTHVAGTVAALNNGTGVIGVAAGATVIPVKVLDRRGSGSISGVIMGVDYVAGKGAPGDVANMSLGGSYYKDLNVAVENAAAKGIKFSLAAGNESTDANTKSPASANGSNIYTISAMSEGDLWASYSNYGNPPIDYCAPGSGILSTYKDGSYATASGTSMAAPHVAGLLLLGNTKTDGTVKNDPAGIPDPIMVYGGTVTPPSNGSPNAEFIFAVNGLDVQFTDNSTDPDGDNTITNWTWNFGDGNTSTAQNPSHTYASGNTYTVTLTVKDNAGAADSESKNVTVSSSTGNEISLSASLRKERGIRLVDLTWSGATGASVIVKINGVADGESLLNDGEHTLDMGRSSGTYTFQICETDGTPCSNEATLIL